MNLTIDINVNVRLGAGTEYRRAFKPGRIPRCEACR